jgi:hypothetical protein
MSELSKQEFLLLKLSEELVEASKECHKAVIHGIDTEYRKVGKTFHELLTSELKDVFAVIKELEDNGIVFKITDTEINKKRAGLNYEYREITTGEQY